MLKLSNRFFEERKLQTLVENQTTYHSNQAEMHVFETHQIANKVFLQFEDVVLVSMIQGKKVMHLREKPGFNFYPGESILLPANEIMKIDFPEATDKSPTRCLALTISSEMVNSTCEIMNFTLERSTELEWIVDHDNFHFNNDAAISNILQRMQFLYMENHPSKDVFLDFMIRELLIRILQSQSNERNKSDAQLAINSPIAFTVQFIQKNLDKPLKVDELSKKAYMSQSKFHRLFKNEMGMTPIDFIKQERLKKAIKMLGTPKIKIKDVLIACGFESHSYFNRVFKSTFNQSPADFIKLNNIK